MAKRTGSADLPLHGGRVPAWLGQLMSALGAIITEEIVHQYGRDAFLERLAHPFWFQSFRRRYGHGLALVGHYHERDLAPSSAGWLLGKTNWASTSAGDVASTHARPRMNCVAWAIASAWTAKA